MNRDDLIRMAREAGLLFAPETGAEWSAPIPGADYPLRLAAFAALVAAAERDACARVCEDTDIVHVEHCMVLHDDAAQTLRNAAVAIRARGEK